MHLSWSGVHWVGWHWEVSVGVFAEPLELFLLGSERQLRITDRPQEALRNPSREA